jgi:carboxynorspermidine decarboxylase
MEGNLFLSRVLKQAPTPCYVVDEDALRRNLAVLARVRREADCRILLALKGFAMFSLFPVIREMLDGTCASSPHEARLGREEFGREVHAFAAAYSESDIQDLLATVDHLIFNSFGQWQRFRSRVQSATRRVEVGLRINPRHSEAPVPLYDPCARYSRLGIPREEFEGQDLTGITGLHFHTLCEQNSDALERTLAAVENQFAPLIRKMQWMNFGGGHHITRPDYDVDRLIRNIVRFRDTYRIPVYLEPGEAVALNTGVLVASVLDVIHNEMDIAILDTSAAAHMPDVLEMPYRPKIVGGDEPGRQAHTYRIAGLSCLAGDVVGDYSFAHPLNPGDKLIFLDMAHYTMVKNTTFNGIRLPSIAVHRSSSGQIEVIREFGYADFKTRLS